MTGLLPTTVPDHALDREAQCLELGPGLRVVVGSGTETGTGTDTRVRADEQTVRTVAEGGKGREMTDIGTGTECASRGRDLRTATDIDKEATVENGA